MPTRPKTHGQRQVEAGVGVGQRLNDWQHLYDRRWQRTRRIFLMVNPLCVECIKNGRTTAASVVDHVMPHRGNRAAFRDESNWQALCVRCHNTKTARYDGGYGRTHTA